MRAFGQCGAAFLCGAVTTASIDLRSLRAGSLQRHLCRSYRFSGVGRRGKQRSASFCCGCQHSCFSVCFLLSSLAHDNVAERKMMKMTHAVLTAAALTLVCATNADILSGPVTNTSNGHLYYLLTTNTWTGAEAEAVSLGGHLITISDAAENDWVCTNFLNYAGGPRALWIGLFQPPGSPEPTAAG